MFGVKPERASAEYGYIQAKNLDTNKNKVINFIEKPNLKDSRQLMQASNVLWNAGMFIFNGSWFLKESSKLNKKMYEKILEIKPDIYPSELLFNADKNKFNLLSSASFDKVFVEKNKENYVSFLDSGWSDLGSWVSVGTLKRDPDSELTLHFNEDITKKNKSWGFIETLMETKNSNVKLLSILPGQKLSFKNDEHRSRTWHLIQGTAKVIKGNERYTLQVGDSVIIEENEVQELENQSEDSLEIIEILSGKYFEENNVVRLKDFYGRVDIN